MNIGRNVCTRFAEYCAGDVRPARYSHEYDKDAAMRSYAATRRSGGIVDFASSIRAVLLEYLHKNQTKETRGTCFFFSNSVNTYIQEKIKNK